MARMMVYNHFDTANSLQESKFGDHFVNRDCTLEEAIADTIRYMRTQYPRRARHFDSDAVLKKVWDISDFATAQKKFYGASKIDDVIRPNIGHYGTQGKEFHTLGFDELNTKVNRFLAKQGQPLIDVELGTKQYEVALEVVTAFTTGLKVVLAELCARFGKTVWSGAVAVEMEVDLVIVASYVKTVFTSFATDLTSFQQFAGYEHVDAADADYQEQVNSALAENKRVFVYLSLANGSKRQERIDFLATRDCRKMLIVDEADFGAHQIKQAQPLVDQLHNIDHIVVMTGTNADRAATHWPIDTIVSVTYPELLMQKRAVQNA